MFRINDGYGMSVRLTVLRIGVPDTDSSDPLLFEPCKQLTILVPFCSEVHFLDASRRMICCAFSCSDSKQMALMLILDWETEDSVMINTGIPYVRSISSLSFHCR